MLERKVESRFAADYFRQYLLYHVRAMDSTFFIPPAIFGPAADVWAGRRSPQPLRCRRRITSSTLGMAWA